MLFVLRGEGDMKPEAKKNYKVSERGRQMVDITGQEFGYLKALYPTQRRDSNGSILWHCRCECGNEKDIPVSSLLKGDYISCSCVKKEKGEKIRNHLHFVDGTCVEWLKSRKHRSDNTSGFRGVNLRKDGKFIATIGFQRKRYYIGAFRSYEEAVHARKAAEDEIYGRFLEFYDEWKKKADQDPEWKEDHPFIFEIKKVEGRLIAVTDDI